MLRIKELRFKKGYSQLELAAILGITRQSLYNYESGIREPNNDLLVKIAIALDTTPNELLDWTEVYKKYADGLIKLREEAKEN